MLELLMLSLQLLGLLQRTGCDQTSIQHGLTITDPAQDLSDTHRHTHTHLIDNSDIYTFRLSE